MRATVVVLWKAFRPPDADAPEIEAPSAALIRITPLLLQIVRAARQVGWRVINSRRPRH
jgi:hypothetical protein